MRRQVAWQVAAQAAAGMAVCLGRAGETGKQLPLEARSVIATAARKGRGRARGKRWAGGRRAAGQQKLIGNGRSVRMEHLRGLRCAYSSALGMHLAARRGQRAVWGGVS